jgi:hypothetical protein
LEIVKIPIEEILVDNAFNNTESIKVGADRIEYKLRLVENLKDLGNSGSKIFDLSIMKQSKHRNELGNILKICRIDR